MFQPWTKDCVFVLASRPPLGSVQSGLNLSGGMGNGVLARYAFALKQANASWSNFGDTSSGNHVRASNSQTLGKRPFRVTYTNPASTNSDLHRHSVDRERQPRLLTIDHATVRLPLLSPRYWLANSNNSLQAWGLSAVNAGASNTLRTMPTNGSLYLLPLNLLRATLTPQHRAGRECQQGLLHTLIAVVVVLP